MTSDRKLPAHPVVDQTRFTRDDVAAGRCSGLQVNTLSPREHQVLLASRGQRPLSLAEIVQVHGAAVADVERQRLERVRAAARQQKVEPDRAVRYVQADGRTWRITVEAVDDGGDDG